MVPGALFLTDMSLHSRECPSYGIIYCLTDLLSSTYLLEGYPHSMFIVHLFRYSHSFVRSSSVVTLVISLLAISECTYLMDGSRD